MDAVKRYKEIIDLHEKMIRAGTPDKKINEVMDPLYNEMDVLWDGMSLDEIAEVRAYSVTAKEGRNNGG